MEFTPAQREILSQALALDVQFGKSMCAYANLVHQNPAPDWMKIEALMAQADADTMEWERLRKIAGTADWYGSQEVKEYYNLDLRD